MDEPGILNLMQTYIHKHMRQAVIQGPLAQTSVTSVFQASIDIVDFILYMEEELAVDEQFNLERLGPKLARPEMTFGDLAVEIRQYLQKNNEP